MAVLQATALPTRSAIGISSKDPRKQSLSQTLSRGGGSRGGASAVAVKTMPANHIKLLK